MIVKSDALEMSELLPAVATRDEWAAIHRYQRRLGVTSPRTSAAGRAGIIDDGEQREQAARLEAGMKKERPFRIARFFTLRLGDDVVGGLEASWLRPEAPDYDACRHLLDVRGEVLPEFRGQKIGRRWLPVIRRIANESGTTILLFEPSDQDGSGFLERIGATLVRLTVHGRLDVKRIDWALVDRWIEEGRQRSPDVTTQLYEDALPESLWGVMSEVYARTANEQPFEDATVSTWNVTADAVRANYARLKRAGTGMHTFVANAPDGAISSYTSVVHSPARPNVIQQFGIGTIREHRGRGLAKWMKAESLKYLRRRYPEMAWILTDQALCSAPLLAIDEQLGFDHTRGKGLYQMSVASLDRAIADLGVPE